MVLHGLFGIQVINDIDTKSDQVIRLANALRPHRNNQNARALADASVLFYIKAKQDESDGQYCTWWLTRESMTVKVATELHVHVDTTVYMRLAFLQDLLLLPTKDDIAAVPTKTWAKDTLLLATPTDALPAEIVELYRKAKRKYDTTNNALLRTNILNMMNAFMALGDVGDRVESDLV